MERSAAEREIESQAGRRRAGLLWLRIGSGLKLGQYFNQDNRILKDLVKTGICRQIQPSLIYLEYMGFPSISYRKEARDAVRAGYSSFM